MEGIFIENIGPCKQTRIIIHTEQIEQSRQNINCTARRIHHNRIFHAGIIAYKRILIYSERSINFLSGKLVELIRKKSVRIVIIGEHYNGVFKASCLLKCVKNSGKHILNFKIRRKIRLYHFRIRKTIHLLPIFIGHRAFSMLGIFYVIIRMMSAVRHIICVKLLDISLFILHSEIVI